MSPTRFWSALVQRAGGVIAALTLGLAPHLSNGPAWRQVGEATVGMRVAIAGLAISGVGLVGILTREGYSSTAYPDPVLGTAKPTLGFGSTEGVKMGDTTTPVKAVNRALREVQVMEGTIKRCAFSVELLQREYDTYLELAHNIGAGAFCSSSIVESLKAKDYGAACNHILDWRYVKRVDCSKPNNVCEGLWADRQRLHRQCLGTGAAQ